jgi:hypothetical protein
MNEDRSHPFLIALGYGLAAWHYAGALAALVNFAGLWICALLVDIAWRRIAARRRRSSPIGSQKKPLRPDGGTAAANRALSDVVYATASIGHSDESGIAP